MLRILLQKELQELVYSSKFLLTLSVSSVLILLSFYVGIRGFQESDREYRASVYADEVKMSTLTDWQQLKHRIFRKPQVLQFIAGGVANDVGRVTDMHPSEQPNLLQSRFSNDPIFAVFRFVDFDFVAIIMFSLFGILFGYDAVNGEKEAGTLKLVFSNRVTRASFILSKVLGCYFAVVIPLLPTFLIGCMMVSLSGLPMTSMDWIRLGLVIIAALLCFGAFLNLSIMFSAIFERSSISFLFSLVFWIFSVFIIPKASILIASQQFPVPTIDALETQKRAFTSDQREQWSKIMNEWFLMHPSNEAKFLSSVEDFQDSLSKSVDQNGQEFFYRLDEDRRNRKNQQEIWALGLSRISPTAVLHIVAMTLAGTDIHMNYRYSDNLRQYQKSFTSMIRTKDKLAANYFKIIVHSYSGMGKQINESQVPINLSEIPVFIQNEPDFRTVISSAIPDLALLALFGAAYFAGAYVAFLKFDMR